METKEAIKTSWKPLIIANPIYDTAFKRLIENLQIAKFFLSTVLEQQIEDLSVMPQKFTYKKLDGTKNPTEAGKEKKESYSIFLSDFMATVRDAADKPPRKILIELQKSWNTYDVVRFRKDLGKQYIIRVDADGKEINLPITTVYILGNNLAETDCPCIKVGRTYTDMINKISIDVKQSEFIKTLPHDSYVIQAGRITDVRYSTNLDKLLSIFEQRYFVKEGSDVIKEYPYQPDDENMTLITGILHEMGADPREYKQIEDEKEFLRILNNAKNEATKEQDKIIEKLDKTIEKQDKTIEELDKTIEELDKTIKEMDKTIEKNKKIIEELIGRIANLERRLPDQHNE